MKVSIRQKRILIILACLSYSLGLMMIVEAKEPWRPETAAAVGRALALAEPSEEEENFIASLGGVQAGVTPVYAGANMIQGLGLTIKRLGISSAAMGDEDISYMSKRNEFGFYSEISLTQDRIAHVKITSPWGTTVLDQIRPFEKLPQLQNEINNLAIRYHDTSRSIGSRLNEQAFIYEGERSVWEHFDNSRLFVTNSMGSLIGARGYAVPGQTISSLAYSNTVYKDGAIRVLPSSSIVLDGVNFVGTAKSLEGTRFALGAKTLPLASGIITTIDYINSSYTENLRSTNALDGLHQQRNYLYKNLNNLNNVAGTLRDTNHMIGELYASNISYNDYVKNNAFLYVLAKSPNIVPWVRADEASTRFANSYLKFTRQTLSRDRDIVIDRTLDLYEDGFRQLPGSNKWIFKP